MVPPEGGWDAALYNLENWDWQRAGALHSMIAVSRRPWPVLALLSTQVFELMVSDLEAVIKDKPSH